MNWHYAEDNGAQGPVPDAEFEALVRAGRVQPTTLVWHEGMTNWLPLSQVAPEVLAAAALPPATGDAAPAAPTAKLSLGEVVCAECGQRFPRAATVMLGGRPVCAGCKPVFVQRLAEDVPLRRAALAGHVTAATEEEILTREYRIDLGESLTLAARLYSENAGLIVGTTAVLGLAAFGLYTVSAVIGLVIPLVNIVFNLIISGPLLGGFLWFLLRLLRREPAALGDAFAGFTRQVWHLVGCSVVQGLINLALILPAGMIAGFTLITLQARGGSGAEWSALAIGLTILFGVLGVGTMIYLGVLWTFSILLVVDKGYGFWDAMQLSLRAVRRRWWMTLLFLFVINLIAGVGALFCLVGFLYTAPLANAAKAHLYDENFRDLLPKV